MKFRNSFWFGDYWTQPTWVLPVSRSGTSNLQHRDVGGFPGWITARTLLASVFCPPSWDEEWVARLWNSAAARKQGCVLWWNLFLPLAMGFSYLWHFKQESLTKVFLPVSRDRRTRDPQEQGWALPTPGRLPVDMNKPQRQTKRKRWRFPKSCGYPK